MRGRIDPEVIRIIATACLLLVAGGCDVPVSAGSTLREVGSFVWTEDQKWFGGLSGMELDQSGTRLTAITDGGRFLTATVTRDGSGAITAVDLTGSARLKGADGTALTGKDADSEGLAIAASGDAFISFEDRHRVQHHDRPGATPRDLPPVPGAEYFGGNAGLEALALHPDGTLYTLPERTAFAEGPFPLLAFDGTGWRQAADIPRHWTFLPVGADFDAEGRLYLLERSVSLLGFRTRVRRFDLTAPDLGEETLLITRSGQHDNLEAISLWQNGPDTHVTLLSDDNFLPLQTTELVDYRLVNP